MMVDDDAVAPQELVRGLVFNDTRINLSTLETPKALAEARTVLRGRGPGKAPWWP